MKRLSLLAILVLATLYADGIASSDLEETNQDASTLVAQLDADARDEEPTFDSQVDALSTLEIANIRVHHSHAGKGKGKGLSVSKGKGMGMDSGKGKGMSADEGKGKGMGMDSGKGKGMGMDSGKGKGKGIEGGKGKGMSMKTGKGKGESSKGKGTGMDHGKGTSESGKGKGKIDNGKGKGKSKGKKKGKKGKKEPDTIEPTTFFPSEFPTETGLQTSAPGGPTRPPTKSPTLAPGTTRAPTKAPTKAPTLAPGTTRAPTKAPTKAPTFAPTTLPALRWVTTLDLSQVAAQFQPVFNSAATRWDRVIVGDAPDRTVTAADRDISSCATLPNVIDDIYICARVEPIDGVGGVLGSAGPELARFTATTIIPYAGFMRFDTADIADLQTRGMLQGVILHEMGHVYGIGTTWEQIGLATAAPNCNYRLNSQASQRYQQLSGCTNRAVPLEQDGGPGTACGHWDEDCFQSELMTGTATGGLELSVITIATLQDLGFVVDYGAADAFPRSSLAASCVCGTLQDGSEEMVFGTGFSAIDNFGGTQLHERSAGRVGHRLPTTIARDRLGAPKSPSESSKLDKTSVKTANGSRRRKLSEKGYAVAYDYGKRILDENKSKNSSNELPEGIIYLGDKVISVLYFEEGEVYTVEVLASD